MNALLRNLDAGDVGFYHERSMKTPARTAISVTFHNQVHSGGEQWMFQDVNEGGPASLAGC
jgi:hypothetical protein